MFEDNDLMIQVATSEADGAAGDIRVQGGTNGHEKEAEGFLRSGDTGGSGARTFIKFDSLYGDSDIRIKVWLQDGQVLEFEMVEAVSVAAGGGQESRTMAAGIKAVAALFDELGLATDDYARSESIMSEIEGSRI